MRIGEPESVGVGKPDRMSAVFEAVPSKLKSPWAKGGHYRFDRNLLLKLIEVQIKGGSAGVPASGGLAVAVDVWIATEIRRAGIDTDAVWPRPTQPRVLPQALADAISRFPFAKSGESRSIQEAALDKVMALAGSSSTNILGGFFAKEIDVVIAEFDRGLELAVSSKTMTDSFGKNITNRFEEASGDLLNIRRRYPLATFGYVYLVTSNVFDEPSGWERIKDMLRKLQSLTPGDERGSYDSTCLLVLDRSGRKPKLLEREVPDDLSPDTFFERMLRQLFSRSPVSEHPEARSLWEASCSP
ncbi:MAG: hypothetical protein ACR2OC_11945 [Solirubrobacterales bacterium]